MNVLIWLKPYSQFASFILSLFFNSLLILLITTKSPKKLGNYKHLMCYFSVMSMIYATIDFVVEPFIHSHGASFSMIMDLRKSILPREVAFFLVASLAGCFGVTIYAIAINFVFRYFAVQRQGKLRYFDLKFLPIWFLIPLMGGASWIISCWLMMHPDPEFTEYLRNSILEDYDLNADYITYTGSYFYRINKEGAVEWHIWNTWGAVVLNGIMSIPFFTILFAGYQSGKIVRNLTDQGESDYTKRLQLQLYKALLAQTAIPMIFLFFPIGILFSAPLIHLNIQPFSSLVTFFYTLYPAVDPIPIIYFIDDYRNSCIGFFKRTSISPSIVPNKSNPQVSVVSMDV